MYPLRIAGSNVKLSVLSKSAGLLCSLASTPTYVISKRSTTHLASSSTFPIISSVVSTFSSVPFTYQPAKSKSAFVGARSVIPESTVYLDGFCALLVPPAASKLIVYSIGVQPAYTVTFSFVPFEISSILLVQASSEYQPLNSHPTRVGTRQTAFRRRRAKWD